MKRMRRRGSGATYIEERRGKRCKQVCVRWVGPRSRYAIVREN
jgi:hypothetical protein